VTSSVKNGAVHDKTPPISFKSKSKSGNVRSDTEAEKSAIATPTGVVCSTNVDLVYTTIWVKPSCAVSGGSKMELTPTMTSFAIIVLEEPVEVYAM